MHIASNSPRTLNKPPTKATNSPWHRVRRPHWRSFWCYLLICLHVATWTWCFLPSRRSILAVDSPIPNQHKMYAGQQDGKVVFFGHSTARIDTCICKHDTHTYISLRPLPYQLLSNTWHWSSMLPFLLNPRQNAERNNFDASRNRTIPMYQSCGIQPHTEVRSYPQWQTAKVAQHLQRRTTMPW